MFVWKESELSMMADVDFCSFFELAGPVKDLLIYGETIGN